jgi:hypothetical protein
MAGSSDRPRRDVSANGAAFRDFLSKLADRALCSYATHVSLNSVHERREHDAIAEFVTIPLRFSPRILADSSISQNAAKKRPGE